MFSRQELDEVAGAPLVQREGQPTIGRLYGQVALQQEIARWFAKRPNLHPLFHAKRVALAGGRRVAAQGAKLIRYQRPALTCPIVQPERPRAIRQRVIWRLLKDEWGRNIVPLQVSDAWPIILRIPTSELAYPRGAYIGHSLAWVSRHVVSVLLVGTRAAGLP